MPNIDAQYSYNFIDLFAGAGGLSEGFLQAGFKPVDHVEMNELLGYQEKLVIRNSVQETRT